MSLRTFLWALGGSYFAIAAYAHGAGWLVFAGFLCGAMARHYHQREEGE